MFSFCLLIITSTDATASDLEGRQEGRQSKWEFGLSVGFTLSSINTTYNNTYSPIWDYDAPDDYTSAATQVLNITHKNASSLSLNGQFNYQISKNFRLQLLAEHHKVVLCGTDNSYYNYLEFTFYPYPTWTPTKASREYDETWPDTEGNLKQTTFSLNLMTRLPLGKTITLDLSGGPSIFRVTGEASSLAYTVYKQRHNWLDYYPDKINFSINEVKLGINIGCELNIQLQKDISLFFMIRYFCCSSLSADIHLEEIIYYIGGNWDLDEAATIMDLQPLENNPSFYAINAGFKIRIQ
jgi:hypothetical protein